MVLSKLGPVMLVGLLSATRAAMDRSAPARPSVPRSPLIGYAYVTYEDRGVVVIRNALNENDLAMVQEVKEQAKKNNYVEDADFYHRYHLLFSRRLDNILKATVATAEEVGKFEKSEYESDIGLLRIHEHIVCKKKWAATSKFQVGWHQDRPPRELCGKAGTIFKDQLYENYSMIIMLSDPKEFKGGELQTATDWNRKTGPVIDIKHDLRQGDAVVFKCETWHSVTRMIEGTREVMVAGLWEYTRSLYDEKNGQPLDPLYYDHDNFNYPNFDLYKHNSKRK